MEIKELLKHYFGYQTFRPQQQEIIEWVMAGHDALVLMPTGGGKSICYQIPAIAMPGTTVVVSPLISLMKDQVEALKANGIAAEALNSGNDFNTDTMIRRQCYQGELKLLYISPEKLLAEVDGLLKHMNISLFAIDEAHCISQWGHDFRPEYAQLGLLKQEFPQTPVMALTATADRITRKDIVKQLGLELPTTTETATQGIFISSFDRPNLQLSVKRGYTTKDKQAFIRNFIMARPTEAGIIYCLSRKNTESLTKELQKHGIRAAAYHAGLSQAERDQTQERFKQDDLQVVCATIAFGMGIDKGNVRWVIHYNMPKSIENFYQEIGRAGRDGYDAETILFYSLADVVQLSQFARDSGQQAINFEKLRHMQEYAESSVCRRRILLNYFGEAASHDCGNCDVCQSPPQRFDGTRYIQMALSAVKRTNEQIRTSTIIEILKGMASTSVMRHHYNELPTFGVGRDASTQDWQDYLLQMLQMGYMEIAYDEGNVVRITPSGYDILYGRTTSMLSVVSHETAEKKNAAPRKQHMQLEIPTISSLGDGKEDARLFEALRTLRTRCAEEEGYPPYIVFSDKVLHSLASLKPTTLEAFGQISGVGNHKCQKYGERFIQLISHYV